MTAKKIIIGCDNAGIVLKPAIVSVIRELDLPFEDLGVMSADDGTYYPLVAQKVCLSILRSEEPAQGILLWHGDDRQQVPRDFRRRLP